VFEVVTGGICDMFKASEEGLTIAAAAEVAYCLVGRQMEDIQSEQIRGCLDDPVRALSALRISTSQFNSNGSTYLLTRSQPCCLYLKPSCRSRSIRTYLPVSLRLVS